MAYSGVASADANPYGNCLNQSSRLADCEISCGILPSSRWNHEMNWMAARALAKSPAAVRANDVQNESRPKNHANPGRYAPFDGPYPATSPRPRNGLSTNPFSTLTRDQSYACCSAASGSRSSMVLAK